MEGRNGERPITVGSLVLSMAGRDSGRVLLVISEADGDCVNTADGRLRRTDRPKRKKRRHLMALTLPPVSLPDPLSDGDVRRAITAALTAATEDDSCVIN